MVQHQTDNAFVIRIQAMESADIRSYMVPRAMKVCEKVFLCGICGMSIDTIIAVEWSI